MDKTSKPGSAGEGLSPRIVALTGFMGSGKTTVGQQLAELLGWEFVDLDELIEQHERLAIRELFAQRGEAEFRNIEHLALRSVLARTSTPTVIALGGGTFVPVRNKRLLHEARARSVFLEAPVDELFLRCQSCADGDKRNPRPLAINAAEFRQLYSERLPSYRRANLTIDVHGKTPAMIAQEIAAWLRLASTS